jgi:hypothetical protein
MRILGVAILGLFTGLAVGFLVFSELIGRLVLANGSVSAPWAPVIGFGPQVLAVVGAVVAVLVDRGRRRGGEGR